MPIIESREQEAEDMQSRPGSTGPKSFVWHSSDNGVTVHWWTITHLFGILLMLYSLSLFPYIEITVHGDRQTSRVVGKHAKTLNLPEGTTIGAIVRQDELVFIDSRTVIESGNHIIMFLMDKRHIAAVEQLFQVSSAFL